MASMFDVGIHRDMVAGRDSSGSHSAWMDSEEDKDRPWQYSDCDAAPRSLGHGGEGRGMDRCNRWRDVVFLAGGDKLFVRDVVLRLGLEPSRHHRCSCSRLRNRRREIFDLVQRQSGLQYWVASLPMSADWQLACDGGGTCGKFAAGR